MIALKKYINDEWGGCPFYVARATKMNLRVTAMTKEKALKDLKNVIREKIKKKVDI